MTSASIDVGNKDAYSRYDTRDSELLTTIDLKIPHPRYSHSIRIDTQDVAGRHFLTAAAAAAELRYCDSSYLRASEVCSRLFVRREEKEEGQEDQDEEVP